VLALVLPSARVEGLLATRQRVGALWRCWADEGDAADAPRTAVCELPVGESSASAGGHNGVQLEGPEAAERLHAAAETLRGQPQRAAAGRRRSAPAAALGLVAIGVAAAAVAVALARRQR